MIDDYATVTHLRLINCASDTVKDIHVLND